MLRSVHDRVAFISGGIKAKRSSQLELALADGSATLWRDPAAATALALGLVHVGRWEAVEPEGGHLLDSKSSLTCNTNNSSEIITLIDQIVPLHVIKNRCKEIPIIT